MPDAGTGRREAGRNPEPRVNRVGAAASLARWRLVGFPASVALSSSSRRHIPESRHPASTSVPRSTSVLPHSITPELKGATPKDALELARSLDVRFLRLQFTDILGVNKHVEIPASQFEKALGGDIMFDGSSIEGFVRIEESDMLLAPDLATFRVLPWGGDTARV